MRKEEEKDRDAVSMRPHVQTGSNNNETHLLSCTSAPMVSSTGVRRSKRWT